MVVVLTFVILPLASTVITGTVVAVPKAPVVELTVVRVKAPASFIVASPFRLFWVAMLDELPTHILASPKELLCLVLKVFQSVEFKYPLCEVVAGCMPITGLVEEHELSIGEEIPKELTLLLALVNNTQAGVPVVPLL